jgi:hypothetical protein
VSRRQEQATPEAGGGVDPAVAVTAERPGRRRARDRARDWSAATANLAGGDVRAGLAFLLGLTAAGPLLGLLWAAISPRLDVAAGISGSETAFTTQADIDATFGFIGLAAGIVAGVIARWRAADGGWPVPLGLAGGGLVGSLLAGWIGHLVRSPAALRHLPPHAPAYVAGLVDVKVRATGLYFVLPATAVIVLAVAIWLPAAVVRRRPEPPGPEAAPGDAFAAASAFLPSVPPPPAAAARQACPLDDSDETPGDGGSPGADC